MVERAALALASMLAAHPQAWVGGISPEGLYVAIPDSVPVDATHRRIHSRVALDHVAAPDREVLVDLWRKLIDEDDVHEGVTVRLIGGNEAEFHLFKVAAHFGADVVVVLAGREADLSAPPVVHDLALSSRFTRVLRDESGRSIEVDAAAPVVLGWTAEELLNRDPPLDRVYVDDRAQVIEFWMATIADPASGHRTRARLVRSDGTNRWFEMTNFNRLDDPDQPCVVTEFLDITEEMAAHEAVRAREQLLHRLAEALPLGVLQLDHDRRVLYKNDYLAGVLGVPAATSMDEQFAAVVDEDRSLLDRAFAVSLDDGADDDIVIRVQQANGRTERIVRVITKAITSESGEANGVIACVSDVTESELMGRELERRATYDQLTGCLNRATIIARLDDALAPGEGGTAVIFLDLDGFKEVNDRYGHAVGDELLQRAAHAIIATTRQSDAVGRLGGDEFLVVCTDVLGSAEALDLANRIGGAVDARASLGASIGVAWTPRGECSSDDLIERADVAMYESKRAGSTAPTLWHESLRPEARPA